MAHARRLEPLTANRFDEMDELQLLLFRQHGVLSRRQAVQVMTADALRHRLESGRWRVAHRAVYLTTGGHDLDEHQRRWVASLAAGEGRPAALGGASALAVLGLRGFAPSAVHVLIPGRYRDHDVPRFCVVHRTTRLRGEVHRNTGPPCTTAARSVIDAAQWATSDDRAAALVAAAFQQRLVGLAEVEAAVARQPRARRRRLALDVARDAAGGAHSLPEVEFLRLCRRAGLPRPRCQVSRVDAGNVRRYLDAYFDEFGVHVEIDGGQHLDPAAWWADMRRQNQLWVSGDRVLRFPSWVVRHRPAEVAAQVAAALRAAGWRG